MARRSQCSSAGDNPLDPNYLPPHYREEYRLAIDALVEEDLEGYYQFLQKADVVDFLSSPEIQYIQETVQLPQQSTVEPRLLETGGDGSSDTYWPLHSDLDAPGLDLGWPQMHHFIGPTEVTTLVNPPEPDMPSIKDQARRLIKNAQQVIAIVMDMFTDVDIFHDILNAAMRNVAVYVLLDEQNTHHFINMVSNCRVNLQSIQFLRVRTVSGMTYHCRSGKSFKGQMMDRFLLTDCRAVLSGNYSFMWSFEKIHRCMAHLFLGQLVSTFDEEFRILFAQSQPLIIEQMLDPMEEFNLVQSRKYPSERPLLYRDPRKFVPPELPNPEERPRHSYDDRKDLDWRMRPLKQRESFHGLQDVYGRFPPHQARVDPSFEQSQHRTPMMENPAFKRHSFAEGAGARYPFQQQQGLPDPNDHARQFHRQQQPFVGPGKDTDYNAYNKFWNQDYLADPYSESGLPPEMDPPENFDPVLNYLSSTRNVDFDQGSDKLLPTPDLSYGSPYSRRRGTGHTSPTPPNPNEQKHFLLEPNPGRKDPLVKQGLRDWRISSYLSAYDGKGDEGLPLAPPDVLDPFEEPSYPVPQTVPAPLPVPKIPNVREFKVPMVPRPSQMPSYVKNAPQEQTKKSPDEPSSALAEAKRTPTPTPSESSSTTEGEKAEEAETHREPKASAPLRDDSFRRKYNAAIPRCSRLRSSLIFSSLDQQHSTEDASTTPAEQEEEGEKSEAEPAKTSFASQVFAHRKKARKPIEWSRFIKSATVDNSATDSSTKEEAKSKEAEKDWSKVEDAGDLSAKLERRESSKLPHAEGTSSPSVPHSGPSEAEPSAADQPKQPPASMLTSLSFVDMNDPDMRLMFFKELAAKRRAEKANEAAKEKGPFKAPPELREQATVEKPDPEEIAVKIATTEVSTGLLKAQATAEDVEQIVPSDVCDSGEQCAESSPTAGRDDKEVEIDSNPTAVLEEDARPDMVADSEAQSSQPQSSPPVCAQPKLSQSDSAEEPKLFNLTGEKSVTLQPSSPASDFKPTGDFSPNKDAVEVETKSFDSLSDQHNFTENGTFEASTLALTASEESDILRTGSAVTRSHSPPPQRQETEFEGSSSSPTASTSDHILSESCTKIIPGQWPSGSPLNTPSESIGPSVPPEESTSTSVTVPPSVLEASTASARLTEEETSPGSPNQAKSGSGQSHQDSVSQLTITESPCAPDVAHLKCDDAVETCTADTEANASSPMACEVPEPGASRSQAASEKDVDESEDGSILCVVDEESEDPGSSDDCYSTPPSFVSPDSSLTKSVSEQNDESGDSPSSEMPSPEYFLAETELNKADQDPSAKVSPLSKPNLAGLVLPTSTDRDLSSSPTGSLEPDLSPGTEKTLSPLHSPTESTSPSEQLLAEAFEAQGNPRADSCDDAEATSDVPTEARQPSETPDCVVSGPPHAKQAVTAGEDGPKDGQSEAKQGPDGSNTDEEKTGHAEAINEMNQEAVQEAAHSEKPTGDKVSDGSGSSEPPGLPQDGGPVSPQSKQARASPSRYHSSTANVLSSSNLRDDTKLLLEQISASSQSRSEASKEAPVTDDEKEDEADKNAKRAKGGGGGPLGRAQPKSTQDREKLLEKIQSMRKERKVYSRFEIAP